MRYITRKIKLKLLQGAALLLVGGLAAGCSSGVSRFSASDFSNGQPARSSNVAMAPVGQGYPAAVDSTYTGSVNRHAVRPDAIVGSNVAQQQPLPPPSMPGQYNAPVAAAQPVTQQPLPAPGQPASAGQQTASLSQPVQTNSAPAAAPKPVAPSGTTSSQQEPRSPAPHPGEDQRLAVLPDAPKPRSRPQGTQTSAAPADTANAGTGGAYTVVSGDTLYGISRKTGASVESIKAANGLSDGYLKIGQTLTIPPAGSTPQVQTASASKATEKAQTASATPQQASQLAQQAGTATQQSQTQSSGETQIASVASDASAQAPDSTGIGKLRWPVRGRIISEYGSSQGAASNDGIDISVPAGTPVKAAENGVVIYAGNGLKEFGNTVLVRHDDGMVTVYGHATALRVNRGDKVKRGQEIALSGMSGNAKQPMLHFEVRKDATPVNPVSYLE